MLATAIAAGVPIISVTTRDTINLTKVIQHLTKKTPKLLSSPFEPPEAQGKGGGGWDSDIGVYVSGTPSAKNVSGSWPATYNAVAAAGKVLVIVNPSKPDLAFFDAGEVPTPKPLAMEFLNSIVDDADAADELLSALGGCTLKEITELSLLCMTEHSELTPAALTKTRRAFFTGSQGLTQVSTELDFYQPLQAITDWVTAEKDYFLHGENHRLMPRGLLFDGPPGTGKTEAAKYIAGKLGVPLFRLDLAGSKNKYVGESQANLMASLRRIEDEAPCVVLMDEIEKVMRGTKETSGTTADMLSQVLWWLAEHRSRVITLMTVNDLSGVPPELFRPGRIDHKITFEGLRYDEAEGFIIGLCKSLMGDGDFAKIAKSARDEAWGVSKGVVKTDTAQKRVAHATLTGAVIARVKAALQTAPLEKAS